MTISLLFVTAVFFSCSNQQATEEQNAEDTSVTASDETSYENILTRYIELKNALVESDAEAAAEAAGELARENTANPGISVSAENIAKSSDIALQRAEFVRLSEQFYELLKNSGDLGKKVYWQYCPMALDNQGANWLSLESEIRNPYFGDAMLTCGEVQEEL